MNEHGTNRKSIDKIKTHVYYYYYFSLFVCQLQCNHGWNNIKLDDTNKYNFIFIFSIGVLLSFLLLFNSVFDFDLTFSLKIKSKILELVRLYEWMETNIWQTLVDLFNERCSTGAFWYYDRDEQLLLRCIFFFNFCTFREYTNYTFEYQCESFEINFFS